MGGTLCGIAVDAGHVYWDTSDFGSGGRIVRANLDGTGVDRGFVTIPGAGSASTPCGVAVDVLLPSTTTVSGSPSSSVYGQPVSLTATVVNAPSPAPIIPTGAVQFAINGDTVGDPVALGPDGRATFTPPDPLDVGDEVTAEYTGNAQLGPSTSPILLPAVQPAASSLVLRSSANPQTADGLVTFTARVTNLNTGIVPFGSVQFVLDGQPTLAPVPLDPSGEAAIVVSGFDPGDVVVAALYHDDTGTPADYTDSQATLTEHITSVSAATPSPTSLGFGPVTLGASSGPQTVTVTNTGRSTLHIGRVALAGADPQDFALATDGCTGVSLDQASGSTPAGTCAVVVRFVPTAPGDRTGALRLASDDPAGPLVVGLAGSGIPPAGPPPPPPPPTPPAPGVPGIPAQSPTVNAGGRASAKLTCTGATDCAGTLELLYPAVGGAKRAVIAHARFTIPPGRTSAVALRLDQAGRSLLRRSRQGRVHVSARVQATVGGQARTLTRSLVLRRRSAAVKHA
jgi:hypothetical protein